MGTVTPASKGLTREEALRRANKAHGYAHGDHSCATCNRVADLLLSIDRSAREQKDAEWCHAFGWREGAFLDRPFTPGEAAEINREAMRAVAESARESEWEARGGPELVRLGFRGGAMSRDGSWSAPSPTKYAAAAYEACNNAGLSTEALEAGVVEQALEALRAVTASATPHPAEHPAMFRSWEQARAVLALAGKSEPRS